MQLVFQDEVTQPCKGGEEGTPLWMPSGLGNSCASAHLSTTAPMYHFTEDIGNSKNRAQSESMLLVMQFPYCTYPAQCFPNMCFPWPIAAAIPAIILSFYTTLLATYETSLCSSSHS